MTESSERLISSLTQDLEPVRRLPRLRIAFAIVLSVWAVFLGLVLLGNEGTWGAASLLRDRIYLASFLGLFVSACGGTVSAIAAGVPGRGRLEIGSMLVAWLGLLAAAVACLVGMRSLGIAASESPPGIDAMCFRHATLLSLLPAGVILSFLVRGWTLQPVRAAVIALLASGALGAGIVHLSCGYLGPRHMLVGHMSVPVVLILLGFYPLAVVLNRIRG